MLTCKKCIYEPICCDVRIAGYDYEIAETCKNFKDKSRCVYFPCLPGDVVWGISSRGGNKTVKSGEVNEIYFIQGNKMCIVAKGVVRGEWGKVVFGSKEDAEAALQELILMRNQ